MSDLTLINGGSGGPDEHEAVLDYAYDMLSGDEKARFEAHLAACARCQAELAAMGHVRQAAKTALPLVEPSERLTGALHTQLMHEAAQRKPAGKVLPFMRRVLRHPAYAAAASLLVIGGAVGVQWSRGKLFMDAPKASTVVAEPPPAPPSEAAPTAMSAGRGEGAPAPVVGATPAAVADQNADAPKVVSPPPAKTANAYKGAAGFAESGPKDVDEKKLGRLAGSKDALSEVDRKPRGADPYADAPVAPATSVPVAKEEAYRAAAKPSDAPPAPAKAKAKAKAQSLDDLVAADERAADKSPRDGVAGGAVGGLGGARADGDRAGSRRRAEATSSFDAESSVAQHAAPAAQAPGREQQAKRDGAASPPAPEAESGYGKQAPAVDPLRDDRHRAAQLAQSGKCDEAIALYGSIEQRGPLTAQDKKAYAGCVRSQAYVSRKKQSPPNAAAASKVMKPAPVPQNADTEPTASPANSAPTQRR